MKLPKYMTTVTPISKLIALGILVLLPFAGFYLGMKYQQSVQPVATLEGQIMNALHKDNDLFKPSEQIVTITGMSGNFVRFNTKPMLGVQLDPAFGFAEMQNGAWKILQYGTGGDPTKFFRQYNIPKELRDKGF